jgi:hypothetical protein
MRPKLELLGVLAAWAILSADVVRADDVAKREIEYLLQSIRDTPCQYERNGDNHAGVEAEAHIRKKYDYFSGEIKTAEDFIRLAATKSATTGKKYYIHCQGELAQESAVWLSGILQRYRVPTQQKASQ